MKKTNRGSARRHVKVAVSLPASLHRRADGYARRVGLSRSALYTAALSDFVTRHELAGVEDWIAEYNRYIESPEGQAWSAAAYQALANIEW